MEKVKRSQLGRIGTYFTFADTATSIFYPQRNRNIHTKSQRLKRYFALHAILYDYLLILDSSLFHNGILQYLCKTRDPHISILPLLENGLVVPALRQPCNDFKDLFDHFRTLRDGSLEWWGSLSYAKLLNSHLWRVLPWDNKPQWGMFRDLVIDSLSDQDFSYFPSQLPPRLLKRLLGAMERDYEKKGFVPRGTMSKEYNLVEYTGYRTSLKNLSDHIYYAATASLLNVDSSFHATQDQKNYIQVKMASIQEQNKIPGLSVLHEAGDMVKRDNIRTFIFNPKFWDILDFKELLKAKEKLYNAEYRDYLDNLNRVLSGDVSPRTLNSLIDSLLTYVRELEALIIDQPGRSEYETLLERYRVSVKRAWLGVWLLLTFDLAFGWEPFTDIINIATTIAGTILGGDVILKGKKKESVRDQLSLASSAAFKPFPIKVAVDTILKKTVVPED